MKTVEVFLAVKTWPNRIGWKSLGQCQTAKTPNTLAYNCRQKFGMEKKFMCKEIK